MQASIQSNLVTVFIISDSVGETAQKVSHATLAQFPDLDQVEVKRFPFVTNEEDLLPILEDGMEKNKAEAHFGYTKPRIILIY